VWDRRKKRSSLIRHLVTPLITTPITTLIATPPPNHKCIGQAHSCVHSQNNAVASVSNISIDLDFIAPLW